MKLANIFKAMGKVLTDSMNATSENSLLSIFKNPFLEYPSSDNRDTTANKTNNLGLTSFQKNTSSQNKISMN